jgi:predicted GTPase
MDILTLSKKIEEIENKYDLENITAPLKNKYAIDNSKKLEEAFKDLENKKTLKIGVIGRVKAGKSTLLNALFFDGENVLPKAATPMTAGLTLLEYGNKEKITVEFFSDEDIDDIRKEYFRYKELFDEIFKNEKENLIKKAKERRKEINEEEINQKALKKAKKELQNNLKLSSSFEIYEKMKNLNKPSEKIVTISKNELKDYVGADGKYMPFTKSVTMKLNNERLKGIQIVDTPGINDPIVSREEKTKELLKSCDVVFVVSPSGQFLSSEDIDLLDRVSTKEGINEIVIVASKIDSQLFGDEKEKNNGILPNVLKSIVNNLKKYAKGVFENDEYLKHIESLKNIKEITYTSGLAFAVYKKFNKNLDENEKHLLNLLKENYPLYFENEDLIKENLLTISNIKALREKLEENKKKKEAIIAKRKEEFLKAKKENLNKFLNEFIEEIEKRKKEIENGSLEELKEKQQNFENIKNQTAINLKNVYNEMLDLLAGEFVSTALKSIESYFKEATKDIKDSEDTITESYVKEYEVEVERDVPLGWLFDKLFGKKKETRTKTITETYTIVRAGFVRNALEDLVNCVENDASMAINEYLMEWKKRLKKSIVSTFRENAGDENVDILLLNKIINYIITKIEFPTIEYEGLLNSLKKSGILKGYEAEEFLNEAIEFKNSFQKQVKKDLNNYLKTLLSTLKEIDISQMIFEKYDKEIEQIKNELENKEVSIKRYELILKELKDLN